MKDLKELTVDNTSITSAYARSHDCEVVSTNGTVTVVVDEDLIGSKEIELDCDITCRHGQVVFWSIAVLEDDGTETEVEVSKEFAQDLLDELLMDSGAELNW